MPLRDEEGYPMAIRERDRWTGGRSPTPLLSLTRTQLANFFEVHPRTLDRWLKSKRLVLTGKPETNLARVFELYQELKTPTTQATPVQVKP